MTPDELEKEFLLRTGKMHEIMLAKNHDYAGHSNICVNAFKNFTMVEQFEIVTAEQGFLTRMTDKLSRLATLLKQENAVKSESFEDTCMDLANYSILLAIYREKVTKMKEKHL